jgi:hypothetical protein
MTAVLSPSPSRLGCPCCSRATGGEGPPRQPYGTVDPSHAVDITVYDSAAAESPPTRMIAAAIQFILMPLIVLVSGCANAI